MKNKQEEWSWWLDAFETALQDAGYESQFDTPVYEFISSEGPNAEAVDGALSNMFDQAYSPEEAVVELEDRDGFWTTWAEPIPE